MVKKALSLLLAAMLLAAAPTLAYAAEPPGTPEISGYTVSYSENEADGGSVISVLSGENQAAEPDGGFYPIEIRTEETDGEKLIIKTYQVPANTSVSLLTEDFEKNGIRYEMQEVLKKPLADELESKTVSKTVTAASDSDKEAKLLQLFEPTLAYDEDGYQGQLQLDAGRIITEVSETEPYRYLVTETRQMSGMDRNDTYYIPKTACKNGVRLQLCNVDWTTMGCGEANGRLTPNRFTATAQYSGYATGSRATEYIATATYTGQVQRTVPGDVLYSIVFAPSVDQPLSPLNEPNEWGGTPFFILGAIILVGAAGTGAWFLWKNRDLRPAREKTKIYMPREMEQEAGGAEDV